MSRSIGKTAAVQYLDVVATATVASMMMDAPAAKMLISSQKTLMGVGQVCFTLKPNQQVDEQCILKLRGVHVKC